MKTMATTMKTMTARWMRGAALLAMAAFAAAIVVVSVAAALADGGWWRWWGWWWWTAVEALTVALEVRRLMAQGHGRLVVILA
jgi:hypothetical protein